MNKISPDITTALQDIRTAEYCALRSLLATVVTFVVATGPCEDAGEGKCYCEREACEYCAMVIAIPGRPDK